LGILKRYECKRTRQSVGSELIRGRALPGA
jgi:hypothetical protein